MLTNDRTMRAAVVNPTFSVILPVRDAQAELERLVRRTLEQIADLGEPFELLIVDDGSRDATEEVAWDLAARYPQVRVLRSDRPIGWARCAVRALACVRARMVFVCAHATLPHPSAWMALWQLRTDPRLAMAEARWTPHLDGTYWIRRIMSPQTAIDELSRSSLTPGSLVLLRPKPIVEGLAGWPQHGKALDVPPVADAAQAAANVDVRIDPPDQPAAASQRRRVLERLTRLVAHSRQQRPTRRSQNRAEIERPVPAVVASNR